MSSQERVAVAQLQDIGKLKEIDSHELLRTGEQSTFTAQSDSEQISSLAEVVHIGEMFLQLDFDKAALISNPAVPGQWVSPEPQQLLRAHLIKGNVPFLTHVLLPLLDNAGRPVGGSTRYPATATVYQKEGGLLDLRLSIVPVSLALLRKSRVEVYKDNELALLAAAVVGPQFILALQGGVETQLCPSNLRPPQAIDPVHGTPYVAVIDAIHSHSNNTGTTSTLNLAQQVTGNRLVTIQQAAHIHGKPVTTAHKLAQISGANSSAVGFPITTVNREELPRHAIFAQTKFNEQGTLSIQSVLDMFGPVFDITRFPSIAAALAFTGVVIGTPKGEQLVEKVISPNYAHTPLLETLSI